MNLRKTELEEQAKWEKTLFTHIWVGCVCFIFGYLVKTIEAFNYGF